MKNNNETRREYCREKARQLIIDKTAEFLAKGGKIEKVSILRRA